MSAHLTDRELEAMLERAERATGGPWRNFFSDYERNTWVILKTCAGGYIDGNVDTPVIADEIDTESNAGFIAHAREDLPAVVKELQAARELLRECLAPRGRGFILADRVRAFLGDAGGES